MRIFFLVIAGLLLTGCTATVEEPVAQSSVAQAEVTAAPTEEVQPAESASDESVDREESESESKESSAAAEPSPSATASPPPVATTEPEESSAPATSEPATTEPAGYTMAMVSANNSSSKCWSVIRSNVYDLTSWIGSHPGGSNAILSICGKEATATFDARHRGQGAPETTLERYLLGTLAG